MKNFTSNSVLTVENGNILFGDVNVMHLGSIEEHNILISRIQKNSDDRKEKEKLFEEKNNEIRRDPNNKDKIELLTYLGNDLLRLEKDQEDLQNHLKKFIENLLSALSICLQDNKISFDRVNDITDKLKDGKIDIVNNMLNIDDIIKRRDLLKKTQDNINIEIKATAREFLLKAKTVQLQINNHNRFNEAYKSYKESICTYKTLETLVEFASFLVDFDKDESITVYDDIVSNYKNQLTEIELGNYLVEKAFLQTATRRSESSLATYIQAIAIFQNIDKNNIIKDIHILVKIADCQKSIAFLYAYSFKDDEAEKHYKEAFEIYRLINNTTTKYLSDYAGLVTEYSHFLNKKRDSKKFIESYKLLLEASEIYQSVAENNDKGKIILCWSLINISNMQVFMHDERQASNALRNCFTCVQILNTIENKHIDSYVGLAAMTNHTLSRVYERKKELQIAVKHMREAIYYMRMRFTISPHEAKEMVAIYYIELADLSKELKKFGTYYECKRVAMNLLYEIQKSNPTADIKPVLGTYEKLIPTYYSMNIDVDIFTYLKDLLSFYEFSSKNNQDVEELYSYAAMTKNSLGNCYRFFKDDDNIAKQLFIEAIHMRMDATPYSKKDKELMAVSIQNLKSMDVHEIMIDDKLYGIEINKE